MSPLVNGGVTSGGLFTPDAGAIALPRVGMMGNPSSWERVIAFFPLLERADTVQYAWDGRHHISNNHRTPCTVSPSHTTAAALAAPTA